MLQDIGSPRGIAHDLANKYWSTICSNAIRAAINLGGNYNAGEVVVGEHVFDNNCRLSWIVAATGIDPLQISIYTEFSAASGGIVSGRNVIYLTDSGAIDAERTNADEGEMIRPTMITMAAALEMLKCFSELIVQATVNGIVTIANSYTMKADSIVKG